MSFLCDLLETINYSHTKNSILDTAGVLDLLLIYIYMMFTCYNKDFDLTEAALKRKAFSEGGNKKSYILAHCGATYLNKLELLARGLLKYI